MAQCHAEPARSSRAATTKVAQAAGRSQIMPSTRQVHILEYNTDTVEWLFFVDDEYWTNSEDSIYTDDLPSTTVVSSEYQSNQLMLMCDKNRQPPRVVRQPIIPY